MIAVWGVLVQIAIAPRLGDDSEPSLRLASTSMQPQRVREIGQLPAGNEMGVALSHDLRRTACGAVAASPWRRA